MKRNLLFVLIITMVSALFSQQKNLVEDVNIPYEMFTLENGLTVIVHEDHKAPIVAVNVWYHVGSKNEKQGKTGFAHLFEHLMFNGSENFNDDYFKTMERIGATDMNGTTNEDRTNYFQNVPKNALDVALWMESDRMGHLLGAISQGKLDEQRGVVQNEKRQGENEPYSVADELTTKATWPAGHPYSWTVIGSMEDLNAASLDDVKEWFKTYYGAANAVVSLAGDIDVKTAKEKMQKYFGDIPSGPPVAKYDESIAKRTGTIRQTAEDCVPQARLYKVWNVPKWASTDIIYLDLLSDVLTSGKTSRLYKKLVYDKKIATNVSAYIDAREIAGQFSIVVTAKPGIALSEIESVVDSELKEIFEKGPSTEELQRVKINAIAGFIRGIERIGGFGGKSDILAQGMVYGGTPDYYKTRLKVMNDATAADLKNAGQKWLSDGQYVLEIIPFPAFKNEPTDSTVRKNMPSMSEQPPAQFPNVERAALSNGLKILLAERHSVPVVNFNLQVDAGYAADQFILPGTASFTLDMMDEGTKTRNALQISDELAMLGANLSTGANSDNCIVTLSSLKANLDKSLNIFADVILNPSFPKEDIERIRQQRLAGIQREKVSPIQMALRVFPKLLYGEHHAYGTPLTGSGNEQSVSQIKREDLEKFHSAWFKPNNATLIVVGDITMKELKPMLEKLFKAWKPGDVQKIKISEVKQKEKSTVFIVDKPGALQSIIFAGNITVPTNNKDELAIQAMNKALGGMFTSRMNMNLREDKHWSYGAQTLIFNTKGERPFITYAAVQTDKTKESMVEVKKELSQIISDKPVTQDEFNTVQTKTILELSGMWETNNAVMGSLSNINRFGYPDDYYSTYAKKVAALKYNDVKNSAKEVVYPNQTVWVVVGDRAKIEQGIKDLHFGDVKYLDADGNNLSTIEPSGSKIEK